MCHISRQEEVKSQEEKVQETGEVYIGGGGGVHRADRSEDAYISQTLIKSNCPGPT